MRLTDELEIENERKVRDSLKLIWDMLEDKK